MPHTGPGERGEPPGAARPAGAPAAAPTLLPLLALAFGLVVRAVLAFALPPNYDQASWGEAAAIAERHGNLYLETARYNYTPLWGQLLGALGHLARAAGLQLHVAVRLFLTLCDLVNALLVARLSSGAGAPLSRPAFLCYWLSPVPILLASVHGQFETLASLPLLLASALALRGTRERGMGLLWVLATLALVVKHLLAFSVLVFFVTVAPTVGAALALFGASAGVFALSFGPYLPDGLPGILRNVLLYRAYPQPYSPFTLLPPAVAMPVFLAAMAGVSLLARWRRLPLLLALELTAVALVVFIPGIGEQYFLLPVLFGAPRRSAGWWLFSGAVTLFLLASPNNVHLFDVPARWAVVWVPAAVWLVGLLRDAFTTPSSSVLQG